MTEQETAADRLRAAAGRVRDNWCTGNLRTAVGRLCALGAFCDVQRPMLGGGGLVTLLAADLVAVSAMSELQGYLVETVFPGVSDAAHPEWCTATIESWNDGYAQSGAEVAEVMEKAAARAEERV